MAEATVLQQIFDYANRADPYPLYAELRKTPVAREPDGTFVVSGYWEILSLLHDPRISSDPHSRAPAAGTPAPPEPEQENARDPVFLMTDPPIHDRLRRLAMRHFGPPNSPERVDGLRGGLAQLVERIIDGFAGKRTIDIVDELAYPLPVTAICDLLGVPPEDEPRFHGWADAIVDLPVDADFAADAAAAQRRAAVGAQAVADLSQYMAGMIEQYRRQPTDNFLSGLVTDDGPAGRMTDGQVLATANLLLLAGHETTVNLIANGMLTLLRHPEVFERLRREPALIVPIIEELLRYEPSVQMLPNRFALADIAIAGTTIRKGAGITLVLAAGNRDPNRFPEPDRFDPDRADTQHLGFGSGIHACFGAPLARTEAQLALTALVQRLENPRLDVDPPPYRHSSILRGPRHLSVTIDGIRS